MDAATTAAAAALENPLTVERIVDGDVIGLRFKGTIDETFDGKRLAAGIRAQTLILDLGQVKRISSFGIREWTEFIETAVGEVAGQQSFLRKVD